MAIATRRLDHSAFSKAQRFLQQAGQHIADNMFFYQLKVREGTGNGLVLDAFVDLKENEIIIDTIWIIEYDRDRRMTAARNNGGERGRYAKILGEKYFNRFFEHLATVDIDNVQERQYMLFDGSKLFTVIEIKEDFDDGSLTPVTVDISQPSKPVIV